MKRIALIALISSIFMGCQDWPVTAPQEAPALMSHYGCPTCHVIPHVAAAVGKVGPSLWGLSQRSYLAGALPNTPENLQQWIMHPQKYRANSAMPEMNVSPRDARIIAGFLESNR